MLHCHIPYIAKLCLGYGASPGTKYPQNLCLVIFFQMPKIQGPEYMLGSDTTIILERGVYMENNSLWFDNNKVHINAHGGGILCYENMYYWFGEHKTEGWEGRLCYHGVHCYSSKDLFNWHDEGIALPVSADSNSPIRKGARIERPKVLYNSKTGKFVMWFHSTDENHTLAKSGVAIADCPIGPYTFLYAKRPDAKLWPINVTEKDKDLITAEIATKMGEQSFNNAENVNVSEHNIAGRDFQFGQMARDMNLFQDDDGSAYHIFASEHNSTLHIAKLSDDYLDHSGEYIRVFEDRWQEAPAMFKRNNKYYLLMSGCTSWAPNAARSAVADSIWGPWKELGNPCTGVNPFNNLDGEKTFGCQSTFVLRTSDTNEYIAMFDEWNDTNFIDSRYVWLKINFNDDGFNINWKDNL